MCSFVFNFNSGSQGWAGYDSYAFNALAVLDGDVSSPVPEPSTMLLLGSGLLGLGVVRRKLRK